MSGIFKIQGTYDTPEIILETEAGEFSIAGRSLPPNSFAFYEPVLKAINEYLEKPAEQSVFNFKMDFISSSSTKIFQEMFHEIEKTHQAGNKVLVNWYYKFGDDDMKELGDDLRMETNFPFEFIAYE